MTSDRPLLGISLMIGFCVLIPFGDALIKLLGKSVPLMIVLLARFTAQALLLWPIVLVQKKGSLRAALSVPKRIYWLIFWRTLMHAAGIVGMYYGLKYMPLADTVAIGFIYPILMLGLGYFFLGEVAGPHRSIAAVVGFIGTLLVVQPNFVAVGWHALWPVTVAITFAGFVLVTRKMAKEIDPISIQAISGVMAVLLLLIPMLLLGGEGFEAFDFIMPSAHEWLLLAGSGVIGTYAHLLMTASLRYAPSTTLAPMQYLEIPFATLIGWMIFSDLPNQLAAWGIVVTIAAGLYIIYREQRATRA
ncbi:MAG: DMT family transporter [Cohaesibacter sp.]|jgi:drug/metabolite transporter (DMT)-like permease|nr:DMT family transporter [Cohaesibacter sp.]